MRSNTLDASRRALLGMARGIVSKSSDSPKMQTLDVRTFQNEMLTGVERFQPAYGISSVPLDPDQQGGKAAEVIVGFINGSRSHPVVIAVDDRRHRPQNMKAGETALYDDQGQMFHVARGGIALNGGTNKLPFTIQIGDSTDTFDKDFKQIVRGSATFRVEDGKITATVGGTSVVVTDGKIALGGADASIPVMIQTGPSSLVFATR